MELLWVSDGTGEENDSFKHFISDEPQPESGSFKKTSNGPRWTVETRMETEAYDGYKHSECDVMEHTQSAFSASLLKEDSPEKQSLIRLSSTSIVK